MASVVDVATYHGAVLRGPDTESLPGADLVEQGLIDLRAGRRTSDAMLVAMAAPRLRECGIKVPETAAKQPSHELYDLLAEGDAAGAHSRYNALVGRVISFVRATERARAR